MAIGGMMAVMDSVSVPFYKGGPGDQTTMWCSRQAGLMSK